MGKRVVDVVLGSVLLLLTAPLALAGAMVSLATYRAWPFFVQSRVGCGGRTFRMVKIRTLAPTTPTALGKHDLEPHRPGPACRFLRAHHLDELPQLMQVISGSMSLVGPRPEMPELHADLPPDFARLRVEVRPGLTGLWQISRALDGLIGEAPEYDVHYVRRPTILLDVWILSRTALRLIGHRPVSSLDDVPAWTGAAVPEVDPVIERAAA